MQILNTIRQIIVGCNMTDSDPTDAAIRILLNTVLYCEKTIVRCTNQKVRSGNAFSTFSFINVFIYSECVSLKKEEILNRKPISYNAQ